MTKQSDDDTNKVPYITQNVTEDVAKNNIKKTNITTRNVTIITATIPGVTKTTLALQHIVTNLVTASQVDNTKIVPPPRQCSTPHAADNDDCLAAMLRELSAGNITIAILPISSLNAQPTRMLHFADIVEQGDLTDRSRRACLATNIKSAPPSLLDLADSSIAARYYVSDDVIDNELRRLDEHNLDKYVGLHKDSYNSEQYS